MSALGEDRQVMDRSNHYEAAFEGYLQWHRLCYVGVDESRRSLMKVGSATVRTARSSRRAASIACV